MLGAATLGVLASAGACSLILTPSSLDSEYGHDGGVVTSSSSGHGGDAGTGGSSGSGGDAGTGGTCTSGRMDLDASTLDASDSGCACAGGCDDAGHCEATALTSMAPTPNGIACSSSWMYAVGSSNIFPSSIGQVLQYDRTGRVCSCIDGTDPASQDMAEEIAVGDKQIVWRTKGTDGKHRFWTLPNADCCCAQPRARLIVGPTDATGQLDFGTGLATDDTSLYWLDDVAVKKAPLEVTDAGSGTVVALTPDGGGGNLDGLAVAPGLLLFDDTYDSTIPAVNLLDGGALSWPSYGENRGIQTNGSIAAWAVLHTSGSGGAIYQVSIVDPSDQPTPLSTAFSQPSGLAMDGQYVYVSDSDAGTISRISIATGSVDLLSAGHYLPKNVCSDGKFLYWLDYLKTDGLKRVENAPP